MTTIPADPQPGDRYAVQKSHYYHVRRLEALPHSGIGFVGSVMSEADARLLVNDERIRSELALIRDMATECGQTQIAVHARALLEQLEVK